MSREKISIRLDYCAKRHLYVNHELPAFLRWSRSFGQPPGWNKLRPVPGFWF